MSGIPIGIVIGGLIASPPSLAVALIYLGLAVVCFIIVACLWRI